MRKREYITPLCRLVVTTTDQVCVPIVASNINGSGAIVIGDGGDNDDDVPDPTAKGRGQEEMNLWGEMSLW